MKYRKKPIIVEATQWHKQKSLYAPNQRDELSVYYDPEYGDYYIDTLEGRHEVTDGDWIVTGIKGEKYPVKPDIFEMTYEKVK